MEDTYPKTLYVGNLDHSVSEELLCALFGQMGTVKGCKIIREAGNDPYAFIEYSNHGAAATALTAMNKRLFLEKEMKVNWATSPPPPREQIKGTKSNRPSYEEVYERSSPTNTTVYCGGFPPNVITEELIHKHFTLFGPIQDVRVFKQKGYAFIKFMAKEAATHAIEHTNNTEITGYQVKCFWGKENGGDIGNSQQILTYTNPQQGGAGGFAMIEKLDCQDNSEVEKWIESSVSFKVEQSHITELRSENSSVFPMKMSEFRPITGGYRTKVFDGIPIKFFDFSLNLKHRLAIAMATLRHICMVKDGSVHGLYLDMLDEQHKPHLIELLNQKNIAFEVVTDIRGLVMTGNWNIVVQISKLETSYDLQLSGGGSGRFGQFKQPSSHEHGHKANTEFYQNALLKTCNIFGKNKVKVRDVVVGVIDSGCDSTFTTFKNYQKHQVEPLMYDVKPQIPAYVQFHDSYYTGYGHGTGVVEILLNCLIPSTKIYVASIGEENIDAIKCVKAMREFHRQGVNIVNCSFDGQWHTSLLYEAIDLLHSSGIMIVAIAGNGSSSSQESDFYSRKVIMVGSHCIDNKISSFSNGICEVDTMCLGENVYFRHLNPDKQSGTSFAAPHATAVIANLMRFTKESEEDMCTNIKHHLNATNSAIMCYCKVHQLTEVELKLNVNNFLWSCFGEKVKSPEVRRKRKHSNSKGTDDENPSPSKSVRCNETDTDVEMREV